MIGAACIIRIVRQFVAVSNFKHNQNTHQHQKNYNQNCREDGDFRLLFCAIHSQHLFLIL
jgi:hypothetical protein